MNEHQWIERAVKRAQRDLGHNIELSQEEKDAIREIVIKNNDTFIFRKKTKPEGINREIKIVPEEKQCSIPGCERIKVKNTSFCSFHKCKNCDKRTHPKHGVFCRECDK